MTDVSNSIFYRWFPINPHCCHRGSATVCCLCLRTRWAFCRHEGSLCPQRDSWSCRLSMEDSLTYWVNETYLHTWGNVKCFRPCIGKLFRRTGIEQKGTNTLESDGSEDLWSIRWIDCIWSTGGTVSSLETAGCMFSRNYGCDEALKRIKDTTDSTGVSAP